ncbi:MAG: ABC transporter ATP-binding protein [Proteiniphilum sp.]|jgi:iron complex transport system ATP-binding protein|nr:ABC transporter ATP-binding protein [Proteiniphilum sp.]
MNGFLDIQDLSCGYGDGFRVQGISLLLGKGSFAGIIGPNGSGKTTLFRGISGSLPLRSGRVLLEGNDMAQLSRRERAQRVAIVPQFPEAAELSVEEYVLMGRLPYRRRFRFFDGKEDVEIAHHYMQLTDTYRLRHKSVRELSGGERQMADIACALAQQPRLLLLDEPTAHLDISHRMRFMNLIRRLNGDLKLSVMMIVHDLSLAAEYCDFLLMMKGGRAFCQGTPGEVVTYEHVERVYDAVVIVKTNPVSGRPVVFPVSEEWLGGTLP